MNTGEWDYVERFQPYNDGSNSDYFGHAVAMNYDGTRLIISSLQTTVEQQILVRYTSTIEQNHGLV